MIRNLISLESSVRFCKLLLWLLWLLFHLWQRWCGTNEGLNTIDKVFEQAILDQISIIDVFITNPNEFSIMGLWSYRNMYVSRRDWNYLFFVCFVFRFVFVFFFFCCCCLFCALYVCLVMHLHYRYPVPFRRTMMRYQFHCKDKRKRKKNRIKNQRIQPIALEFNSKI